MKPIDDSPIIVTDRHGQNVPIDFAKIHSVIAQACHGLNVDPLALEREVRPHFFHGISTTTIQEILIHIAHDKISADTPDWTYAAARLLLHQWYQEVEAVQNYPPYQHYPETIFRLVDQGRYDTRLVTEYSADQITQLEQAIRPERDHLFTYPALTHLRSHCALHDRENHEVELPQHIFMGIAAFLALAETPEARIPWAIQFYNILSQQYIILSTQTLAYARTPKGQLSSCFVDTLDDSISGIFRGLGAFAQVAQNHSTMSVYLGHLRATGSNIRGLSDASHGVTPWAQLYNDTAASLSLAGKRSNTLNLWLDVWHKDLLNWLNLPTDNHARPGITIPDYFYKSVKNNLKWSLFDPHEVITVMGFTLEDVWGDTWTNYYLACLDNPQLSRIDIPAQELMQRILEKVYETGYPLIMNRDTINRFNPNKHEGMIYASNLCTGIAQNQSPSQRHDDTSYASPSGHENPEGDFAVGNLCAINLAQLPAQDLLAQVIPIQVRLMDNLITLNHLPVSQAMHTNLRYRALGITITGYRQHLALKHIAWESDALLDYSKRLFEFINFTAISASTALAAERGAYPLFPGSDWDTGAYFDLHQYTSEKWAALRALVHTQGMRNGYLLAMTPTSLFSGTTQQILPMLEDTTWPYSQDSDEIDPAWSIKAAAIRQHHLDQNQSLTLNATPELDISDLLSLTYEAWKNGVKTLRCYRHQNLNNTASAIPDS